MTGRGHISNSFLGLGNQSYHAHWGYCSQTISFNLIFKNSVKYEARSALVLYVNQARSAKLFFFTNKLARYVHKLLYKTLKVKPSTTGPTQWYNTASRTLSNQLFVVKFQKKKNSTGATHRRGNSHSHRLTLSAGKYNLNLKQLVSIILFSKYNTIVPSYVPNSML